MSREAPLKLSQIARGDENEARDWRRWRNIMCDEVEISALSATFGVVFWAISFPNVIGWTRTMAHWKAHAKTLKKGACPFCSPTLVPSESSFETIYAHTSKFSLLKFWRLHTRGTITHMIARAFPEKKFMSL